MAKNPCKVGAERVLFFVAYVKLTCHAPSHNSAGNFVSVTCPSRELNLYP